VIGITRFIQPNCPLVIFSANAMSLIRDVSIPVSSVFILGTSYIVTVPKQIENRQ
jgi:hypothetical protein